MYYAMGALPSSIGAVVEFAVDWAHALVPAASAINGARIQNTSAEIYWSKSLYTIRMQIRVLSLSASMG